jgi:phage terminase small subunit
MSRLKAKHERFCRNFVEYANATLAAKTAGYSPASARNAGYRSAHRRANHRASGRDGGSALPQPRHSAG